MFEKESFDEVTDASEEEIESFIEFIATIGDDDTDDLR